MKKILLGLVIIICTPILLYLFNITSFALPNYNIRNNIIKSKEIYKTEDTYFVPINALGGYRLDNFTDELIMTIAFDSREDDDVIFKRSISNIVCSDKSPYSCLDQVSNYSIKTDSEYSR